MEALWQWISLPAHYAPLAGLAYSILEHFLGKTKFGSFWGVLFGATTSFLQKKSTDK